MNKDVFRLFLVTLLCIGAGCAIITTPTGGKKDKTPPKLRLITPADSLKNTKVKRIELNFDEYVTVSDAFKEVQISPLLPVQPNVTGVNRKVVVKIADTMLEDNTTYRISFGSAIRDLHESNVFANYTYTFSTGSYFDSLQLAGRVFLAATGLPDTASIIMLYNATDNDSTIVRKKPKYIGRTDAKGMFTIKGLPQRKFRIYAVHDANNNLMYDGSDEMVAFNDNSVLPGDSAGQQINLRVFAEIPKDSTKKKTVDSSASFGKRGIQAGNTSTRKSTDNKDAFGYTTNIDSSNAAKRSFDINDSISINFSKLPAINKSRITLSYDSNDVTYTPPYSINMDTLHRNTVRVVTPWRENTKYTLKLTKGFAKDTGGVEANPAKFLFLTKQEEDYGKIRIHLPAKYADGGHILEVFSEKDSVYHMMVTDTIVNLNRLKPAKYTFRIIVDKNKNGKWDTGDLLGKKQPEEVIPYADVLGLKAGWENDIDFEQKPVDKKGRINASEDKH